PAAPTAMASWPTQLCAVPKMTPSSKSSFARSSNARIRHIRRYWSSSGGRSSGLAAPGAVSVDMRRPLMELDHVPVRVVRVEARARAVGARGHLDRRVGAAAGSACCEGGVQHVDVVDEEAEVTRAVAGRRHRSRDLLDPVVLEQLDLGVAAGDREE